MAVVQRLKDKIDRMKITIPLTPAQYSVALSILHGIGDVADSPHIKHWRGQYGSRLMLKDGLQSIAQINTGISKTQLSPTGILDPLHDRHIGATR